VRLALRERLVPLLVLTIMAAGVPTVLLTTIGHFQVSITGQVHFLSVGFSALVAAVAAAGLTIAGARRSDTRTVLVGTAFAVMATLLALHGLATPGVLVGNNGVVAFTGAATLPVGGAILALSVIRLPSPVRRVRPLLVLEAILLVLVTGLGVSAILLPSLVPAVPAANSPSALALLAAALAVYAILIWRALRTSLLTRRWVDFLVVIGLVWLATAIVPALTMGYSDLGWWMGHEVELDGIVLVGLMVALDLARTTQSRPLVGDLRAGELVKAEEAFLGSHVRALTKRLAENDEYTEQHTRRVAHLAVQVGELLGLSRSRLRALAIGGLVHDIGKLSVPNAILKKPNALDDDEYAVIMKHPEWGNQLLEELGGFSAPARRLVRDHHERLDGNGYPRRLPADHLDLDTRILTVCDVYDALISPRVYRPAWTQDDAIALLRRETGTAFDTRCVAALEQVLMREADRLAVQSPRPHAAPQLVAPRLRSA